ncbi:MULTISPECIES: tRNA (adenosine(37)-N6)-threonylcarbamoyltransferase complex ATPase subunit type 1 TsaE [Tenacibaculum]|uniref:tRNA (adenosine(37)-N6)-threonylcarbamoyltransferase complex ATPase subunit type 1 TsaE n=1 Tax=Tenacibaculum TaxID=104267 RepID=UPI00089D825F|nr:MULTISPECIES: tRNA (adenosine(37)-N6)-threonylcarbamoyltransferase complex ATPase subunit type 1 TsaE [unclassified Tenacibaculum]RBW56614.1 tRNA (adenosine(37)-N6)-threonylcarbamoyltransferase complex ATPase subunit type 1 TsaE [Tenacibaculum sp. E3R01]SEE53748.1 tRNA threonylcarbamoyladenosine biosynthesis protein TsaE [Tenacibaculum sp. MAR_2010_89]
MDKNYSLKEIPLIAEEVIKNLQNKIVLFQGEMGVGKTTLIKEICKVLGVEDVAHSPTFSLVNEYHTNNNGIVYHFDFYRIETEEEAYDMGIEDYLYSNQLCLIEWPENVKNLLPLEATTIQLSLLESGERNIQLKTN